MKKIVFYAKFSIVLWLATAARLPAQSAGHLKADAERILKAIDSICGDAWCEGAFDFHFQKVLLKPDQNETQLLFRMSQEYPVRLDWKDGASFKAQINRRFYDVSCVLPGYASYDSLMQSAYSLRREVYTALTQCINGLEDRLMQVTEPLSP